MGGMYLTDDLEQPTMWQIPEGININAGEYLLFWADDDEPLGDMHTNFKLSSDGEAIGLYDTDLNLNIPIDFITFESQTADISFGRCPDGGNSWSLYSNPTPGETNDCLICGDTNGDGLIDILDIVYLINYRYKGGPDPVSLELADVNNDDDINILDIVCLINFKYKGGSEPQC
ncbi:MAG: hypothetical protein GY855_00220 [candidate division Zixibacteria bacterium]|nr:hypothetical protein [candidate division Zixibacteria bacterium]